MKNAQSKQESALKGLKSSNYTIRKCWQKIGIENIDIIENDPLSNIKNKRNKTFIFKKFVCAI